MEEGDLVPRGELTRPNNCLRLGLADARMTRFPLRKVRAGSCNGRGPRGGAFPAGLPSPLDPFAFNERAFVAVVTVV
jgi:hypothetical protein